MRVLVIHNYYQQRGGEDECAEQEVRLLREHGHEVRCYSRHNDEIRTFSPLRKARLFFETTWSARTVRDIRQIAREFRPDLAHVHNFFPLISPSVFHACAAAGVPVVYTLHNYRLLCPVGWLFREGAVCEECVERSLRRSVRHRCYHGSALQTAAVARMLAVHRRLDTWRRKVSGYVVLSAFSRRRFAAAGLPAERLFLRPNFHERLPAAADAPRSGAVFVGRLSSEKGVAFLLRCWRQLPDVPLTVLGDGPLRSWAEGFVRENGLGQVRLAGFRPQPEVLDAVRRAAVLVVPSLWYEACIRTIIEAYAAGTPVIATRLGSLEDMVADRRTGLLFAPGDDADFVAKVREALADPGQLRRWGQAAQAEFEAVYSPEAAYSRMMEIYAQALAPRKRLAGPPDGRFTVLTADVSATTLADAAELVLAWVRERARHYVNVCTSDTTVQAYRHPALAEIINRSGLAAPDGMPLVWLGRLQRRRVSRVYGPDLMLAVCERGQDHGVRHFFYGTTAATLSALCDRLTRQFPKIVIAGVHAPPFRPLSAEEERQAADLINAAAPDIVWVGLGTPKQDFWVARMRPALNAPVLIAVGAAFDFHSGRVRQAPRWMMRCGLEWFYRFCREPRRLGRRYLVGNAVFLWLILRQWLCGIPRPMRRGRRDRNGQSENERVNGG